MRAILVATGYEKEMAPLLQYRPTPLLNIADRPILFHILEFLASAGVTTFDLVLHHLPEMIENEVGEGERWGIKITYHLSKSLMAPYTTMRFIVSKNLNEMVLLGRADVLPNLAQDFVKKVPLQNCLVLDRSGAWTGWAFVQSRIFHHIPSETDEAHLFKELDDQALIETVIPLFSTRSYEELKLSNERFITKKDLPHLFPTTARMVEPGIWISRGVSLHPTAHITPPVFIGQECQIKGNTEIGPNAIIESQTIISEESIIEDSLICRNSFVGESLEIRNSIVDRNLLINLNLNAAIHVKEDFILGELTPPSLWRIPLDLMERVLALVFLVLLSPVYLYMRLKFRLREYPVLFLPARPEEQAWSTINWAVFDREKAEQCRSLRHFGRLPVLWSIMAGNVHFVGVSPRTIEETEALPHEWKNLYLRSKIGLITLSDLDNGPEPMPDEQYASEVFYAVHMNWRFDILLMMRWLRKKVFRLFGSTYY